MARVNMTRSSICQHQSPHSQSDNVTTPYLPIRLLKGAPPGQEIVNYYTSELQICRNHGGKQLKSNLRHLDDIQLKGKYDFHHNFFEGPVNRNKKFYQPEIATYENAKNLLN